MSDRLRQIIESYCDGLPDEIERLSALCQTIDFEQIRFSAHRVKGTARSLGLEALQDALLAIEARARAHVEAGGGAPVDEAFAVDIALLRIVAAGVQPRDSTLWKSIATPAA